MIKNIKKIKLFKISKISNIFEIFKIIKIFKNAQILKKFITYLKRPKEVKFPKTFGLGGGETFPLLL